MKFLAILKDSLREALDLKIFYAMVALSLLTVVLVSSISFEHEPAEKGVEHIGERIQMGPPPKPVD